MTPVEFKMITGLSSDQALWILRTVIGSGSDAAIVMKNAEGNGTWHGLNYHVTYDTVTYKYDIIVRRTSA